MYTGKLKLKFYFLLVCTIGVKKLEAPSCRGRVIHRVLIYSRRNVWNDF